ncbi:DUF4384 domain-containing protein [Desulfogranum mediterraneum]|uniref:DUF4384 domain-containing protein n=1 Tax=Desulfogranum mediterraneum TaxID=160661 RepID=UPI00040A0FD0|nr:DUF4384 domain-containing protein [Desulfogranum mediterraneum]
MKVTSQNMIIALAATALFMSAIPAVYADMAVPGQAISRDLSVEQRPMTDLQVPQSDLAVTAWVDHQDNTYRAGDTVTLSIKPNKDAYLTILDVGTSGKVHIIFPNQFQQDNRVRAGQIVQVPGKKQNFDFRVGGPVGSELIKVIATTSATPLIKPGLTSPAGPYKAVHQSAAALAKDLSVVARQDTANQYAEYNKVIRIVDGAAQTAASAAPAVPATPVIPAATGVRPAPAVPALATTGTVAAAAVELHPENVPFSLHLRAEKSVYRYGEKARIMATPEKDCRLTVLDVGTSGQVTILYPNRYQQDNRLRAGQTVVIPGDAAAVDYVVGGPEGVEALIGICRTDDRPVFTGGYDFQTNVYQPWGNSQVVAKDLAVVLQEPAGTLAHTATTFLVTK